MTIVTNVIPRNQRPAAAWLLNAKEGSHGDFGKNSHGNPEPDSFPTGTSVSKVLQMRGMDYAITMYPTAVLLPGPNGRTVAKQDGGMRLVRPPKPGQSDQLIIGNRVSDRFEVVQNMEIAAMLDPLVTHWPVRAAGEFGDGTTVYVALDAGDTSIGGDEMHDYFMVSDVRDGGHTVTIAYLSLRKVCSNGLMMVTKATRIKLPHRAGIRSEAEFYVRFMTQIKGIQEAGREELAKLAAKEITAAQAQDIIAAAHPMREQPNKLTALQMLRDAAPSKDAELSKDDVVRMLKQREELEQHAAQHGGKTLDELTAEWELLKARVQAHRERVFELYDAERADHAGHGSAFLAVQAVAEYADWRTREDGETEALAEGSLFGKRQDEKMRALRTAERLAAVR